MANNQSLKNGVLNWNGKSADDIRTIFDSYNNDPNFLPELLELIEDLRAQDGATWLLKAWFDSGKSLSDEQSDRLLSNLPNVKNWPSKLHVLQCFDHFVIPLKFKIVSEQFLRQSLMDQNKFVRAWAYNGFYVLAVQYPEYRDEIKAFFEQAMKDEAASVKARIRNIMKHCEF